MVGVYFVRQSIGSKAHILRVPEAFRHLRVVLIGATCFSKFSKFGSFQIVFLDFQTNDVGLLIGGGVILSCFSLFSNIFKPATATTTHSSSHSRGHRGIMSEASFRPQRKTPRPSGFMEPGESTGKRTTAGPGPTVMPGFSGASSGGHNLARKVDEVTRGMDAAASRQDGCSAHGARRDGSRENSSSSRSSSSCGRNRNSNSSSSIIEVGEGNIDTGIESTDDDFDLAPSAVNHLPPPPVDTSSLDDGDDTTAPDSKSSGCDTPPCIATSPSLVLAPSTSSSPPNSSARDSSAREKSLLRAKGKAYSRWPASLLRFACGRRGIIRMTREKDTPKMAALLVADDKKRGMSEEAHTDDLWGDGDQGENFSQEYSSDTTCVVHACTRHDSASKCKVY